MSSIKKFNYVSSSINNEANPPYEEIVGILEWELDQNKEINKNVAGLHKYAKNNQIKGKLNIHIIQPLKNSNHVMIVDIVNRGIPLFWFIGNNATSITQLDLPYAINDGFYLRQGFTYVACGWQADLLPLPGILGLRLDVKDHSDDSVVKIMSELDTSTQHFMSSVDNRNLKLTAKGHVGITVNDSNQIDAKLFELKYYNDKPIEIPRDEWRFGKINDNNEYEQDDDWICYMNGFKFGYTYQIIFDRKGGYPTGIALAILRDCISWLKYGNDIISSPIGQLNYAIAVGGSQSGRLLRTWVNDDFNVDEKNREIFDGISNWVSGSSRGQFNQYFGQPSVAFPHLSPIQFPFTITESVDPATDHIGSLHENIDKRKSKLKVFYINTSIEYHRGDASLLHTSLNGEKDIPISSNSRVYLLCGCPHNPMPDWPPSFANGLKNNIYIQQNYYIPVHLSPFYRAQLLLLTKWITQSIEPPKSIYPTLKSNSLVLHEKVYQWFQSIPNSNPPENKSISRLWRRDFGYSFNDVPSIDENGNDVDGILLPHIVVPLATYTGWALRHPNFGGEWKIMMISGSLIPFSITKSMRLLSNDPRLSIEERYTTKEQYLNKTNEATLDLIQKQFLLEEDLQSIILFSSKLWDWIYSL